MALARWTTCPFVVWAILACSGDPSSAPTFRFFYDPIHGRVGVPLPSAFPQSHSGKDAIAMFRYFQKEQFPLPPGLLLDEQTGKIHGTPKKAFRGFSYILASPQTSSPYTADAEGVLNIAISDPHAQASARAFFRYEEDNTISFVVDEEKTSPPFLSEGLSQDYSFSAPKTLLPDWILLKNDGTLVGSPPIFVPPHSYTIVATPLDASRHKEMSTEVWFLIQKIPGTFSYEPVAVQAGAVVYIKPQFVHARASSEHYSFRLSRGELPQWLSLDTNLGTAQGTAEVGAADLYITAVPHNTKKHSDSTAQMQIKVSALQSLMIPTHTFAFASLFIFPAPRKYTRYSSFSYSVLSPQQYAQHEKGILDGIFPFVREKIVLYPSNSILPRMLFFEYIRHTFVAALLRTK